MVRARRPRRIGQASAPPTLHPVPPFCPPPNADDSGLTKPTASTSPSSRRRSRRRMRPASPRTRRASPPRHAGSARWRCAHDLPTATKPQPPKLAAIQPRLSHRHPPSIHDIPPSLPPLPGASLVRGARPRPHRARRHLRLARASPWRRAQPELGGSRRVERA